MSKPSVEDMFSGKANRYSLVIAVAKRAREITDEMILRGEIMEEKSVNVAINEFKNRKYVIAESN